MNSLSSVVRLDNTNCWNNLQFSLGYSVCLLCFLSYYSTEEYWEFWFGYENIISENKDDLHLKYLIPGKSLQCP